MNKTLAVSAIMLIACGAALGQGAKEKFKTSESKKIQASKANAKVTNPQPAGRTRPPQAQPFPTRRPESKVELNPQPLPPGAKLTSKSVSHGSKVSLNPQPLPPGRKVTAADKAALNPQPLPPGKQKTMTRASAASKVSLNPQPLPPGMKTDAASKDAHKIQK